MAALDTTSDLLQPFETQLIRYREESAPPTETICWAKRSLRELSLLYRKLHASENAPLKERFEHLVSGLCSLSAQVSPVSIINRVTYARDKSLLLTIPSSGARTNLLFCTETMIFKGSYGFLEAYQKGEIVVKWRVHFPGQNGVLGVPTEIIPVNDTTIMLIDNLEAVHFINTQTGEKFPQVFNLNYRLETAETDYQTLLEQARLPWDYNAFTEKCQSIWIKRHMCGGLESKEFKTGFIEITREGLAHTITKTTSPDGNIQTTQGCSRIVGPPIHTFEKLNNLLVYGGSEEIIRICNPESLATETVLLGHEGTVTHLKFKPPHYLVSASEDHTIRVWDCSALTRTSTYPSLGCTHTYQCSEAVTHLALSDREIVTAHADGTIQTRHLDEDGRQLLIKQRVSQFDLLDFSSEHARDIATFFESQFDKLIHEHFIDKWRGFQRGDYCQTEDPRVKTYDAEGGYCAGMVMIPSTNIDDEGNVVIQPQTEPLFLKRIFYFTLHSLSVELIKEGRDESVITQLFDTLGKIQQKMAEIECWKDKGDPSEYAFDASQFQSRCAELKLQKKETVTVDLSPTSLEAHVPAFVQRLEGITELRGMRVMVSMDMDAKIALRYIIKKAFGRKINLEKFSELQEWFGDWLKVYQMGIIKDLVDKGIQIGSTHITFKDIRRVNSKPTDFETQFAISFQLTGVDTIATVAHVFSLQFFDGRYAVVEEPNYGIWVFQ